MVKPQPGEVMILNSKGPKKYRKGRVKGGQYSHACYVQFPHKSSLR